MQHRTPSSNTQRGASLQIRAVIYVFFQNHVAFLRACFIAGRRQKKEKPSRHRRMIPPRSGLGIVAVCLVFWNAEIQARTSVPFSGTPRSRRERPVVLHRAFHTTRTTQVVPSIHPSIHVLCRFIRFIYAFEYSAEIGHVKCKTRKVRTDRDLKLLYVHKTESGQQL